MQLWIIILYLKVLYFSTLRIAVTPKDAKINVIFFLYRTVFVSVLNSARLQTEWRVGSHAVFFLREPSHPDHVYHVMKPELANPWRSPGSHRMC